MNTGDVFINDDVKIIAYVYDVNHVPVTKCVISSGEVCVFVGQYTDAVNFNVYASERYIILTRHGIVNINSYAICRDTIRIVDASLTGNVVSRQREQLFT